MSKFFYRTGRIQIVQIGALFSPPLPFVLIVALLFLCLDVIESVTSMLNMAERNSWDPGK